MTIFSTPTRLLWLFLLPPALVGAQPPVHSDSTASKTPHPKSATAPHNASSATTATAAPRQLDEDTIDTILRARRRYGSLLKGTIFEPKDARESERMFVEALQAMMSESAKRRASGTAQSANGDSPAPGQGAPALDPCLDEPLVRSLELTTWLLRQKARRLRDEHRPNEAERLDELVGRLKAEANRWRTTQRPMPR